MDAPRLLLDLEDRDALVIYARDCRRRNDNKALRALGRQRIATGALVELSPEDPVEWIRDECERSLAVGDIEIPLLWDKRRAVSIVCDVTKLVLPISEEAYPEDTRPRVAIETARMWLRGEASEEDCYCAADDAWSSAVIVTGAGGGASVHTPYVAYAGVDAAYAAAHGFTSAAAARATARAAAAAAYAAAYASYTVASASNAANATFYAANAAGFAIDSVHARFLREQVVPLITPYALTEEV